MHVWWQYSLNKKYQKGDRNYFKKKKTSATFGAESFTTEIKSTENRHINKFALEQWNISEYEEKNGNHTFWKTV
jgi:hypothetical protein